jgi:hypothetical protein
LFFTYRGEVEKFAAHISMRLPSSSAPSRRQSSALMLCIYVVIVWLTFLVFVAMNVAIWLSQLTQPYIAYQLDTLTLTLAVAFALAIYHGVKLSREWAAMEQARGRAEYDLAESMVRTETERALRLGRRPAWDFSSNQGNPCETNLESAIQAMQTLGALLQTKFNLAGENAKIIDHILSKVIYNLKISMRNACDLSRSGTDHLNDVAVDNRR